MLHSPARLQHSKLVVLCPDLAFSSVSLLLCKFAVPALPLWSQSIPGGVVVRYITGKGLHSAEGKARIKPEAR